MVSHLAAIALALSPADEPAPIDWRVAVWFQPVGTLAYGIDSPYLSGGTSVALTSGMTVVVEGGTLHRYSLILKA